MANRDEWERSRIRGWERERDWDPEDRYEEGYSDSYRSPGGEESRGRWGASERYGRSGSSGRYGQGASSGRSFGRSGWEREDEGFRDYERGRSMSERRGAMFERDWGNPQEGYGQLGQYGQSGQHPQALYGQYGQYGRFGEPQYGTERGRGFGAAEQYGLGRTRGYGSGTFREGWGHEASTGVGRSYRRGYGADWRSGPHAGRGPKGWKRSDERIREDVNEALARDPDLDASSIEVTVLNSEVTLIGVVEDRGDKRLAEDIAEEVFGVEDVHNQLKVRHGAFARITGEKADEEDERVARQSATTGANATAKNATSSPNASGKVPSRTR